MPVNADAPTIASLDLFVSVVELGSLSAAARAHGMSQPSASARIRHLERQVGFELLTRGPGGSVPTAAGVLVADWSRTVLGAFDELQTAVSSLRTQATSLRVAASYTVAEHLLPRWLGRLRAMHPEAHLELEVVNSASVLERVRSGNAQLGFIETPGSTAGLRSRLVGRDELAVVVAPSHPWARLRRPLSVTELAAMPLVLREVGSGTRESFVEAVQKCGAVLADAALELGSTAAVRAATEEGAAPAVLSRLAVADALATGRLVNVAVAELDLRRELLAVWLPGRAREQAMKALLATAVASEG